MVISAVQFNFLFHVDLCHRDCENTVSFLGAVLFCMNDPIVSVMFCNLVANGKITSSVPLFSFLLLRRPALLGLELTPLYIVDANTHGSALSPKST